MSDFTLDPKTSRNLAEGVVAKMAAAEQQAAEDQPAADWLFDRLSHDREFSLKVLSFWNDFESEHGSKSELFGDVIAGYATFLVDPEAFEDQ